jgi:hypothetical protein
MRKGGSKQKGNSFERAIAVKLSNWLTNNVMDNAIWRTDTSGGRSTINIKKNNINSVVKDNIGDLKQVVGIDKFNNLDTFFKTFFIELKIGYRGTFIFNLPLNKDLKYIIDKCIEQSKIIQKCFCLIIKQDRKKEMIVTNYNFNMNEDFLTIKYNQLVLRVYLLDDILKYNLEDLMIRCMM